MDISTERTELDVQEATLRAELQRITNEIRTYPPPIAGCDAQFNYLLEQRTLIKQQLSQLRKDATAQGNTR